MARVIVVILVIVAWCCLMIATPSRAADVGSGSTSTDKVSSDINLAWKKTVDKKYTEGNKTSKTRTKGRERSLADSDKRSGSQSRSGALDITAQAEVAVLARIGDLEEAGVQPFAACQVVTAPKLPSDFGLSAMNGAWIDTVKADYINKAAASNAPIASLADDAAVRRYRDCVAMTGAVAREALLILQKDIKLFDAGITRDKAGAVEVRGIGYDDFGIIASAAVDQVAPRAEELNTYKKWLTDQPCRFDGKPEALLCGRTRLVLGAKPELTAAGVTMYGAEFGGVKAAYKLSSSWSVADTMERAKNSSVFAKFAEEVGSYTDDLKSKGKMKESAYAQKIAAELVNSAEAKINSSTGTGKALD